ncbi:MAG: hypothetical protein AB7V77_03295 [Candidatus Woesearchaeota archaeon]
MYLQSRLNKKDSNSFFKKVESLIPKKTTKKEFSSDSLVYEDEKPKRSFLSKIFARFYSNDNNLEEIEDDLSEDVKEQVEEIEEEIETVDEAVEELEEKREGLLRRFFKMLFGINEPVEEDIDVDLVQKQVKTSEEILKEETRAVLKSIHKWLSRLPPEYIDAFRRSSDFTKYKDLLEKYDLIRKE